MPENLNDNQKAALTRIQDEIVEQLRGMSDGEQGDVLEALDYWLDDSYWAADGVLDDARITA